MVDQDKVRAAVEALLEGIGEDPSREGLVETPARVARMYAELLGGMDLGACEHLSKTFAVTNTGAVDLPFSVGGRSVFNVPAPDASDQEFVVERDIIFHSLCEHHMLPFFGKVAIGYIPSGRVAGLSKLARTVEVFARRLQLQERMTAQVADALMDGLGCKGVIVLVEAEHMCMSMRGVQKPGTKTVTLARRGAVAKDPGLEARFLAMLGR